jgi:hypothetical protein
MQVADRFTQLLPLVDEAGGKTESFAEYQNRVSPLLPRFPEEVLRDWLYKHGRNALYLDGCIDIHALTFRDESWSASDILEKVSTSQHETVSGWKRAILGDLHRGGPLGSFMVKHGTWPVPPVVLDNDTDVHFRSGILFHRFHLLEGHHRLGYLQGLATDERVVMQATHRLWLAKP